MYYSNINNDKCDDVDAGTLVDVVNDLVLLVIVV